jgi:phospholipid/cholesterol/gamma-HCH transport system permease protein
MPLQPVHALGRYALLLADAARSIGDVPLWRDEMLRQAQSVGFASIPIVALAAFASGSVMAVQAGIQLDVPFVPPAIIGAITVPATFLELAVLIMGFVLAGRVGARIAAELATMRVSEQIDALAVMGVSPAGFLVLPRVLAAVVTFPVVYVAACALAVAGALLVTVGGGFASAADFWLGARRFFDPFHGWFGLIKSVVFGALITSIACYKGFGARGGAEGVGRATTQAAVTACVWLLIVDFAMAVVLL